MLRSERRERRAIDDPSRSAGTGLTAAAVGRALRNERVRQGLSHRDVARQLGLPEEQLRAAESGTLATGDQLSVLKTVRRFADLLGLPGDRYALAILEQWPTAPPVAAPGRGARSGGRLDDPTAAIPAVGAPGDAPASGVVPGDERSGEGVTPFEAGFALDATYVDLTAPPTGTAGSLDTGDATGIVPAVPIATTGHVVRHNPMPMPLRVTAVVLVVAVIAGGAVLAIDRLRPSWLRSIEPARTTVPAPGRPVGGAGPHGTSHGTVTHGASTHGASTNGASTNGASPGAGGPGTSGGSGAVVTDALRPQSTGGSAATVDAGAAPVQMTVSSVSGPCWVQVTSPTSIAPLFDGVVAAGAHHAFTLTHGATVELGSAAGRVSVTSSSGHLSTYRPPVAPFDLTVHVSG